MTDKIQAAVIGLGVGMAHARGYQVNPNAELCAICDIDPVRLKERGDQLGVPEERRYIDYNDMLKLPELSVVSVAVPNHLHAPITIGTLRAGKNVLCEKPLAMTAAEAASMVAESRACGRKLMVCFNYRFREDARWLKAMGDAGRMGEVYFARAGWQRSAGIPGGWFTSKALSGGGPLIDLGVHVLDLTLWLMGHPRPVAVSGQTFAKFGPYGKKMWGHRASSFVYDVEDLAAGFVRFDNGAALQIETSWATHTKPGRDDYFVTLNGSAGSAELYVANYTDRDTLSFYTEECGQAVMMKPNIVTRAAGHELAVAHIVDCVLNDQPVEATGEQGTLLMQIIEGLYESSQTGREVRVG